MAPQPSQEDLAVSETVVQSVEGDVNGMKMERGDVKEELGDSLKVMESSEGMSSTSESSPFEASEEALTAPTSRPLSPLLDTPQVKTGTMPTPQTTMAFSDLPSRKRGGTLAELPPRSDDPKRRGVTPVPGSPQSDFSFRSHDSSDYEDDILDLTGADVDEDSTFLANQIKRENFKQDQIKLEKKYEQEKRDLEMAIQMSSQEAALAPSSSAAGPSGIQPSNAFSKMMATQRANAARLHQVKDERSDEDGDDDDYKQDKKALGSASSTTAGPSSAANMHEQTPQSRLAPNRLFEILASTAQTFAPQQPGQGTFGSLFGLPSEVHEPPDYLTPNYTPARLGSGLHSFGGAHPTTQVKNESSLASLISKTSAFNYATGVDQSGNPLPNRLVDYLRETAEDAAVTEKELDDLLANIRPDVEVRGQVRDDTPRGLKYPLYPHQSMAIAWMKQMEEGTNKGGILADDMGLGKTVSTIALMLSRPATSRPKTNLIIGPLSLIRQWEEELVRKTSPSHRLSVFVYHNKKVSVDELLRYDVVLTTYGTVTSDYRRFRQFKEDNADRSINYNDRSISSKFPLMHPDKASFHRIILDEAQCIKNKRTMTAEACHYLRAKYRWCLTGTPMMNSVLELYSLLQFLRIKPYSAWEKFRVAFGRLYGKTGDPKSVAMNRLRALLKAVMLRRKKDSEINGYPILVLPEKTEEVIYAELSQDERDFYVQLEKSSQVQFSKYLRDGSVGKNYSNILVLLLRLRQACCHPHLNLDVDDATSPTMTDDTMKLVRSLDAGIVVRIKETENFDCPICYDVVQNPWILYPCAHITCVQCLTRLVDDARLNNLRDGLESDTAKCPVCRSSFDPQNCFVYAAFEQVHMPEQAAVKAEKQIIKRDVKHDASDGDDDADSKGNLKGFVIDDDGDANVEDRKEKKKEPVEEDEVLEIRPSMLRALREEAAKSKRAYKRYINYLRRTWLPASKVSECIKLLKQIQESGEKAIVFSQWTLLLDLIEVGLWHEYYEGGIRRYNGGMSAEERFAAAQEFRDKRRISVMLVSLRAGNAGLNLTAASRVIIMDPFWNPYIERQAIDRAHRIGQQREVKVYRILTRDTVEDRIIALQERKKEMVEAALDEAEGMKISRLGVSQLKFLFNA